MGKKKISFLILLIMLSNIHSYSQKLFVKELQWKEKKQLVGELYESMTDFVNDTTPVVIENNKTDFYEMSLSDLFYKVLKKKKINEQLTLQKQKRQKEMKEFLDSNFLLNNIASEFVFADTNQIIKWGQVFSTFNFIESKELNVRDSYIFILMMERCSGVRCSNILIFKQEKESWKLMTGTETNITEKINIIADNTQKKILFKTKAKIIGELLFE